ncbi:MAG: hypothetical protein IKP49_10115 [Treponema sp.]|nr:hypothetical protein [Treponema sp.]
MMKRKSIFVFFCIALSAVFASCAGKSGTSVYKFDFPKMDITRAEGEAEAVKTEKRCLPKEPVQGEVRMYVEELLLGPESSRLLPIFSLDATVDFCFMQGDDLYLGISESSVYNLGADVDIQSRIELLESNIHKNFKNIGQILLFIGDNFVMNKS